MEYAQSVISCDPDNKLSIATTIPVELKCGADVSQHDRSPRTMGC